MIEDGFTYAGVGFFLSVACAVIAYVLWGAWQLILRLTDERRGEDISNSELFAACMLIGVTLIVFWISLGWLMMQFGVWASHKPG